MEDTSGKRTRIVATIGPSTAEPEMLRSLIDAGLNVVRLNFSHGSHDWHREIIENTRRISHEMGQHIAILQDLPGPKVRTSPVDDPAGVVLVPGATFRITTGLATGDATHVGSTYDGLARDVEVGKRIYLADGSIALRILEKNETDIYTRVEVGGVLRGSQGINYPDGTLDIDAVTDRDFEHLAFGIEMKVDWVAVSFVRSAKDVIKVREFIHERGFHIPIMSKIEKHEALDNIEEIVEASDGIMVARGDLGIELPLERVPLIQKDLIARANRASKPVVTATQMLESMITNARPTRAEVNDVANAILDGTDAVMLSGESARGAFPLEAVRTMAMIAAEVECEYPHEELQLRRVAVADPSIATSIAQMAVRASEQLDLKIVVTGTTTGNTARHISSFRPRARIIALTPIGDVARRLSMVWGVEAVVVQAYRYIETLIEVAEARILQDGYAKSGDWIAITSGMPVGEGGTNVLKLHQLN